VRIPVDRDGPIPIWRQIAAALRTEILSGALPPGARLPSTRRLAADLSVSRILVENAYAELAADGVVEGRPGSGTFVAGASPPRPVATAPVDEVSFRGVGDPDLYPVKAMTNTIRDVVRRDGSAALGYGAEVSGHPPLRATIAQMLASQGIHVDPRDVLITSGSQQGLALVFFALLRRGDPVVVERPTYDGALELLANLGAEVIGVDVDPDGMRVDQLADIVSRRRPRLIYTVPTFQNPTGASMAGDRRRRMLEIAESVDAVVVEDDFVGDLHYDGPAQPALRSLASPGRVVYLGTFSKLLMPSVRVGYLLADPELMARFVSMKRSLDLSTSLLMQVALDRYLAVGRYQAHLARCARLYRPRRDALVAAVRRDLGWEVSPPAGGLFLWARLPSELDSGALADAAERRGTGLAAGASFFPDGAGGEQFVRLNFVVNGPERMREGVRRLQLAVADLRGLAPR